MSAIKNPLNKILPASLKKKKPANEDDNHGTDGEKKPLLGLMLPGGKKKTVTTSREAYLGPHDSVRVWDVKMPPIKADMVKGQFVPTLGGAVGGRLRQKTSRISIEVHSDKPEDSKGEDGSTTGRNALSSPTKSEGGGTAVMEGLLRGTSMKQVSKEEKVLHDDEYVVFRIFRPSTGTKNSGLLGFGRGGDEVKNDEGDMGDEHSEDSVPLSGVDKEFADGKWTEAYLYSLDDIEVAKHRRHTVELKLGRGTETKVRDINFRSTQEATAFCSIMESLGKLESGRAQRRVDAFLASPLSKDWAVGSKVQLLVEIVSAVRLPVADLKSTDAYVTVHLGKEQLHRTSELPNTLNPVWTIETGSLFLLEKSPEDFFSSGVGCSFTIYDYDAVGKDDTLGRVFVTQEELLEGTGERVEYPLVLDKKYKKSRGAKLVLRVRRAEPVDVEFMRAYAENKRARKIVGVDAEKAFVPIRSVTSSFIQREKRRTKVGKQVIVEHHVKPGPDPSRPKDTMWMTSEKIDAEALRPSHSWIQCGSGSNGRLYFELIRCDGLPNMDSGPMGVPGVLMGGKTDSYACVIFEDAIVNTDVVYDSLSPRWLPWTQRAFVFNVLHPSSQLHLAILDHDSANPLDDDDPIGRVSIDPCNMRPNTDYMMQLELVTSAVVSNRQINGTVTVRIRIEWESERNALIRSLMPPPAVYVNVARRRDFLASHYAVVGETDTSTFSMDTLASFVEELQGYQELLPVLKSALFTVLLWRGHFPVTVLIPSIPPRAEDPAKPSESLFRRLFKPTQIKLPIHSTVSFIGGILLAEDFSLLPSFILFGISWMLLGTMEYANSYPSPWRKKRTYWEHMQVLIFNRTFTDTIDADERKEEIEKYLENEAERKKEAEEEAAKEAVLAEKAAAAENEGEEAEVSIETKKKRGFGISINLLQPILSPVQDHLETVVVYVRIVRSFLTWEESRANFWIVNTCFIAGLLLIGIPWGFLTQWAFRIAVWVFLGPWMRLVDIFLVKGRTREELRKEEKEKLRLRYQQIVEARRWRQIRREDALKMKSMKRYLFGDYIVRVPQFKENRYSDWALSPSHASPYVGTTNPKITANFRGQHLEGTMLPDQVEPNTAAEADQKAPSLAAGRDDKTYGSVNETS